MVSTLKQQLKFPSQKVTTAGGDIEVRTLTPDAVEFLISKHFDALHNLMHNLPEKLENEEFVLDLKSIIGVITKSAPELLAEIIAVGCRDYSEETVEFIRAEMGLFDQVESVKVILELTFRGKDDLKNLIASVTQMATFSNEVMGPMIEQPQSSNGSGRSKRRSAS